MGQFWRWAIGVVVASALVGPALALDGAAAPSAPGLVRFNSDEGLARLARASVKRDFAALANQFEAQSNVAFCGPTTAAIVLNALRAGSKELPRDRSRLSAQDWQHAPAGVDLTVARYTQDNVIAKGSKTRAQVLGEPVLVDGIARRDPGYQLHQLEELLAAHGLATRRMVVDDTQSLDTIRADLAIELQREGVYVIVNYRREAVGQLKGAHISPLGAYDAASDSVLVMDVNPSSAGWVWVPLDRLVAGMRTFDTVENRGYLVVRER